MNLELVTIGVIVANVLVSLKGFNDYAFRSKYIFNIGAIHRGEHIRMITSAFLHADMQHLAFNMITLFFFADTVVYFLGATYFLLIYLGSLLLGSLFSFYFHKDEHHYSALGASGAVSGILFSAVLLRPTMMINFIIPGYVFAIGYLLYSIYGMKNRTGNIGHDAHFGGAVAGFVITLLLKPELLYQSTLTVIAIGIPIVVLFVMNKMGKI
ncbi:Rhomboid protease GluP [Kordia antarctica]|uniref:Rhomboid protease GluP n=1 Tax=Kordia antarctica TaxID=1218801 RepID=A0A7L4ZG94_9FLAO|nr:rhomboid family intramembrane serine protease [Kordia antarctica]QHI34954.1 Rhomboid protease GluP [Kordia antarctica]